MPDKPVWEDIRRDYEDHTISTKDVLARHGISRGILTYRIEKENWRRRPTIMPRSKATPEAGIGLDSGTHPATAGERVVAPSTAKKKATPIAKRRALVQRLYNAIDTKLGLLERRFQCEIEASGKATSAADFERDARAIGTLIKNLEQVTEYDHGNQPGKRISGAAAKSASIAATALADEADRLRRELAERLQRLVDPAQ